VLLNRHSTPGQPREGIEAVAANESAVILSTVEAMSTQLVDTVIPAAGEFVAHNPLQEELGLVYSDVRSALDFLALNFLPTAAAPQNSTTPPTRRI
jgi:hypothetical protein